MFEVPYEVPFIAITEAAFSQLVNEQYAVLRRALAAQERLERIVLSERGLEALAGALAALIGAAVLVFDPRGEPLVQHAFRRPVEDATLTALQGELRERGKRREARAFMPSGEDGGRALALPVAADGTPGAGGADRRFRGRIRRFRAGRVRPDASRHGRLVRGRRSSVLRRRGWSRSRTPGRCRISTG